MTSSSGADGCVASSLAQVYLVAEERRRMGDHS